MSKPSKFAQPFPDYEILDRLGSGGMGTVFKARRKSDDAIVAIKVLRPSLSRNSRYVDRLRREAEISMRLDHPGLVKGYGLGEEGGYHYLVMEFVPGRSLKTLLKMWGRFPEEQVLDVGIQLTEALAEAHEQGVVHRDIKPGNVLVDEDDRAKLTDLGLAKGESDPTLTRDGATVGTPQYMSPEQAQDPAKADERSDLYSLGATLYHMAVGLPPFEGDSVVQVISKLLNERADSAGSLNPEVSTGVNLILRRLLAKVPDLRYQSARELLADLKRVQAGQAPSVDVKALARAEGLGSDRARGLRAAALAGAAVVIVGVLWLAGAFQSHAPVRITKLTKLEEAVTGAKTLRTKLALIDAFTPQLDERVPHRALRQGVVQEIARAITALQGELGQSAFGHWLDSRGLADWEDEWFIGRVQGELYRRLNFLPRALPDDVRELWSSWLGRQKTAAAKEVDRRCARIVAQLSEAFETGALSDVDRLCGERKFAAAMTLLDGIAKDPQQTLLAGNGGAATKRLPAAELGRLKVLDGPIDRARKDVRRRARQCLDDWEKRVDDVLTAIDAGIDNGAVATAEREITALRGRIEGEKPWQSLPKGMVARRFNADLESRGLKLALKRAELERRELEVCQDNAHRVLASTLDVDRAEQQLSTEFLSPRVQELRKATLTELALLRKALTWIAETAWTHGKSESTEWVLRAEIVDARAQRVTPGSPPSIVLRVKKSGVERKLPLSAFARKHLANRVREFAKTAHQQVGLGLFLFYSDHFDDAYELLGRQWVGTLDGRRARRQAALATADQDHEEQAARRLDALRRLLPTLRRDYLLVRRHLEALEKHLAGTKVVQSRTGELADARAAFAREGQRRATAAQLAPELRDDGLLELSDGGGVTQLSLTLPLDKKGAFRNGIDGWQRVGRGLAPPDAAGDTPRTELAAAMRLLLPALADKRPFKTTLRFTVPADGRALDLLLLETTGGRILLGQMPDAAGRIGVDVPTDRGAAIRETLASKAAAKPWYLVPGASYELRIEVGPVRATARTVSVFLDGVVITGKDARIKWRRNTKSTLSVAAVGRIVLHSITIDGEVRG